MQIYNFPMRLSSLNKSIVIKLPKSLGLTTGVYLHEIARKIAEYNTEINCDAAGVDKQGATIKVNTLGRWIFGVPGFQSHLRIVPQGENVLVYYPEKSPELVERFLHVLKNTIEQSRID
jgi:hypothetical protein